MTRLVAQWPALVAASTAVSGSGNIICDSFQTGSNPKDGRHFSIEMPQLVDQASSAVITDRVSMFVMCCVYSLLYSTID